MERLLTQGRSKGISVVTGMQRPARISRFALSESTHTIAFFLEGRDRKLILIEDAAQALGADEGGKRAGSWGDFGSFSFYPTKNLSAAGDAGLMTARDAKHADLLRMLRHHGSWQAYEIGRAHV